MGLKDILNILRNKINKKYSCLDPTGLASSAEVPKPWGAPPGGPCWTSGGRLVCTRDIFIFNEIWTKGKIYILICTLLG
jgi:hypothetical protein